jgi:hypothetical protein
VARIFFKRSGKKLFTLINSPLIKAETASAINMRAVPSFAIFQEISKIGISRHELSENTPLIPPVTIISERVRDNLHSVQALSPSCHIQLGFQVTYLEKQEITHHYYPLQGQGCPPVNVLT